LWPWVYYLKDWMFSFTYTGSLFYIGIAGNNTSLYLCYAIYLYITYAYTYANRICKIDDY